MMEGIVNQNIEQQLVLDGVFRTQVSGIAVDGDSAVATICGDYRDVIGTDPNGTYTSQEIGLKNAASTLTLSRSIGNTWIVLTSAPASAC